MQKRRKTERKQKKKPCPLVMAFISTAKGIVAS
jgi:hypothetical protein